MSSVFLVAYRKNVDIIEFSIESVPVRQECRHSMSPTGKQVADSCLLLDLIASS